MCFYLHSLNGTRSALFPTGVSKQLDAHSAAVSAIVATRPDGYIVSASADITMRTWDVRTGLLLYTITSNINQGGGHSNPVNALAVLHNGLLVSGASEPIAIVWNFTVPSLPVKLSTFTASSGSVYTLSATVDGGSVISGGSDHSVKVH